MAALTAAAISASTAADMAADTANGPASSARGAVDVGPDDGASVTPTIAVGDADMAVGAHSDAEDGMLLGGVAVGDMAFALAAPRRLPLSS